MIKAPMAFSLALLCLPFFSHGDANTDRARQIQLIQTKGCASCHGTKGQGNTMMKGPKLAGQTQKELASKIRAYKSGERQNPTMAMMTYSLTDEEIEKLASYFSQFK